MSESTRQNGGGHVADCAEKIPPPTPACDEVRCKYDELGRVVWERDPATGAEVHFGYYEPADAEPPAEKPARKDRLYDYHVSPCPPSNTRVTYPPGTCTITRHARDMNRRLISRQTVVCRPGDAWPFFAD